MIGLLLIILHILIVVLAYRLIKKGIIKSDERVLIIIAAVPVWGFVAAFAVTYIQNTGKAGIDNGDIELMRQRDAVNEGSAIVIEEAENIVPLEDALIMDDSSVKRSVIMDVLMSDVGSYIPVLDQARMNEDVEVVHYATTAMAELSKDYEIKLQQYSKEYGEDPEKEGLLDEYTDFLERYISSNMMQGQLLEIQRTTYQQLLAEKIARSPEIGNYVRIIRSYMDSMAYSLAEGALDDMEKKWPKSEELWKLKFRYYYETGDAGRLKEMLAAVNADKSGYSKEIREIVDYWSQNERTAGA